jgi:hypothetical protein
LPVLRLLHRQNHQIEVRQIVHLLRCAGMEPARQGARIDFQQTASAQVLAALDRQAHADAFGVDPFRRRRAAGHRDVMPRRQTFDGQERAVGGAQNENVEILMLHRIVAMSAVNYINEH